MKTLEELKKNWDKTMNMPAGEALYDRISMEKVIRAKVKQHTNTAMQYFWASFILQILVYALFSHVAVKYWSYPQAVLPSLVGIALYIPFTIMLLKRFKAIATLKPVGEAAASMQNYVYGHHQLLQKFFTFKKGYEYFLIPVSSAIGVYLIFELYVPGGAFGHPTGAVIILMLTLLSCLLAIRAENKRNFERPLRHLSEILQEF